MLHVNGHLVRAEMHDDLSETAQSVVVCDRGAGREYDRYVVWTVAQIGGKTEAWNGAYCDSYVRALHIAAVRAAGVAVLA